MTNEQDEFQVLEEIPNSETETERTINELFSLLPKTIRSRLSDFVDTYPTDSVAYNVFAGEFNRFLRDQYVKMLREHSGTENKHFYNIQTAYVSNSEFWKACKEYADKAYPNPENMSFLQFINVASHVIQADGFNVATHIYK